MAPSDSRRSNAPLDESLVRDVLGYLNFSNGTPDPKFQGQLNRLFASLEHTGRAEAIRDLLLEHLKGLQRHTPAFADSEQAQAAVKLTLVDTLAAYRSHHADLLFHLSDNDFEEPLFIVRVFEAVLAQGAPWEEGERIVAAALDQLNDFLGYRPLAVLENERLSEPYPHERFRPLPLYIEHAGVGAGRYFDLIDGTLRFLADMPAELIKDSHFELSALGELALDVRAHDHTHPMNKRTNYMFGEWDPDAIDNRGRYRRFVIRKIVLDSLLDWMDARSDLPVEERLHDASAVLCGTVLMASSISGSGPGAHDSNVTLTGLLPIVARQRDAFYARLLESAQGKRAQRLQQEADLTRQPFGHVRQHLNIALARYGAKQIQRRHLAYVYARLGHPDASREQVAVIPSVSARFECEIQCRLSAAYSFLGKGDPGAAFGCLQEVEEHLQRGIECGAVIDPWNILAFQGQFPLFSSREDSIADERAETLLSIVGQTFDVYSRALSEASVQADGTLKQKISARFRNLADWWDRFAAVTVEDLPAVLGMESWQSAELLSGVLAAWRAAGESAGDISFWRSHVDKFSSAVAYAQVVDTLLHKRDLVAAMGLLMQWLSEADEVGIEAGEETLNSLLGRWLQLVLAEEASPSVDTWPLVRKLFDYLEANAGPYWDVPRWNGKSDDHREAAATQDDPSGAEAGTETSLDADDEDDLYGAAYENVVYRDSAWDGHAGDTVDWGDQGGVDRSEFEMQALELAMDPRLRFIHGLAELWQMVGADFAANDSKLRPRPEQKDGRSDEQAEVLASWLSRAVSNSSNLFKLMQQVWTEPVAAPVGDDESDIETDRQLQFKFALLHSVVVTRVGCEQAELCLGSSLPKTRIAATGSRQDRGLAGLYQSILRGDVAGIRRRLPAVLASLVKEPLLYVPIDNGGHPTQYCDARSLQTTLKFLLTQLPRLGLLRETFAVLKAAFRMERTSRPAGQAVTEFDGLFQIALGRTLQTLIESSSDWRSGRFGDDDLVDLVGEVVERYLDIWLKHSRTMRISSVESLKSDSAWDGVKEFIEQYGADLFQPRLLTPGNLRSSLHDQVGNLLDQLDEEEDPLHPIRLLEDLRQGVVDREDFEAHLELIYSIILDKFDRFIEYSTTTTQSDYGEMLYSFLDFLRMETAYERDAWNLLPVKIAHEQLASAGRQTAALMWERIFESNTSEMADRHVAQLEELESRYGMRLPSVTDHLQERFVKPLAVNRIIALVPDAIEDAKSDEPPSAAFSKLRKTLEDYLDSTASSSLELPIWLNEIDEEIERVEHRQSDITLKPQSPDLLPLRRVSLHEVRRQLNIWNEPLAQQRKKP